MRYTYEGTQEDEETLAALAARDGVDERTAFTRLVASALAQTAALLRDEEIRTLTAKALSLPRASQEKVAALIEAEHQKLGGRSDVPGATTLG